MSGPVEIIGQELERAGIRRPDWALAFLWGFLLGRAEAHVLHDEEKLRDWCRTAFAGRRNQNGRLSARGRKAGG